MGKMVRTVRKIVRFCLDFFSIGISIKGLVDELTEATIGGKYKWHRVAGGSYKSYFPDERYLLEVYSSGDVKLFVVDGSNEALLVGNSKYLEMLAKAIEDSLIYEDLDRELKRFIPTPDDSKEG